MKLYLLRHATAVDVASSDAQRELTKEGREEARIVGAALAMAGLWTGAVLVATIIWPANLLS